MRIRKLQLALLAAALAGTINANATMVYTTEASFLSAIQPGYFLENFNSLPDAYQYIGASWSSSGGSPTFAYTITSPAGPTYPGESGLYTVSPGGNKAISTLHEDQNLIVSFTSGNVTAVGGDVFLTDYNGAFIGGNVKINLSDGSSVSIPSTAGLFTGFAATPGGPVITSMVIQSLSTGDDNHYPTLDHLYIGAAVPEPTTMIAGALLLLPFGASTLRILRRRTA